MNKGVNKNFQNILRRSLRSLLCFLIINTMLINSISTVYAQGTTTSFIGAGLNNIIGVLGQLRQGLNQGPSCQMGPTANLFEEAAYFPNCKMPKTLPSPDKSMCSFNPRKYGARGEVPPSMAASLDLQRQSAQAHQSAQCADNHSALYNLGFSQTQSPYRDQVTAVPNSSPYGGPNFLLSVIPGTVGTQCMKEQSQKLQQRFSTLIERLKIAKEVARKNIADAKAIINKDLDQFRTEAALLGEGQSADTQQTGLALEKQAKKFRQHPNCKEVLDEGVISSYSGLVPLQSSIESPQGKSGRSKLDLATDVSTISEEKVYQNMTAVSNFFNQYASGDKNQVYPILDALRNTSGLQSVLQDIGPIRQSIASAIRKEQTNFQADYNEARKKLAEVGLPLSESPSSTELSKYKNYIKYPNLLHAHQISDCMLGGNQNIEKLINTLSKSAGASDPQVVQGINGLKLQIIKKLQAYNKNTIHKTPEKIISALSEEFDPKLRSRGWGLYFKEPIKGASSSQRWLLADFFTHQKDYCEKEYKEETAGVVSKRIKAIEASKALKKIESNTLALNQAFIGRITDRVINCKGIDPGPQMCKNNDTLNISSGNFCLNNARTCKDHVNKCFKHLESEVENQRKKMIAAAARYDQTVNEQVNKIQGQLGAINAEIQNINTEMIKTFSDADVGYEIPEGGLAIVIPDATLFEKTATKISGGGNLKYLDQLLDKISAAQRSIERQKNKINQAVQSKMREYASRMRENFSKWDKVKSACLKKKEQAFDAAESMTAAYNAGLNTHQAIQQQNCKKAETAQYTPGCSDNLDELVKTIGATQGITTQIHEMQRICHQKKAFDDERDDIDNYCEEYGGSPSSVHNDIKDQMSQLAESASAAFNKDYNDIIKMGEDDNRKPAGSRFSQAYSRGANDPTRALEGYFRKAKEILADTEVCENGLRSAKSQCQKECEEGNELRDLDDKHLSRDFTEAKTLSNIKREKSKLKDDGIAKIKEIDEKLKDPSISDAKKAKLKLDKGKIERDLDESASGSALNEITSAIDEAKDIIKLCEEKKCKDKSISQQYNDTALRDLKRLESRLRDQINHEYFKELGRNVQMSCLAANQQGRNTVNPQMNGQGMFPGATNNFFPNSQAPIN